MLPANKKYQHSTLNILAYKYRGNLLAAKSSAVSAATIGQVIQDVILTAVVDTLKNSDSLMSHSRASTKPMQSCPSNWTNRKRMAGEQ